jgi:hypothetical protein
MTVAQVVQANREKNNSKNAHNIQYNKKGTSWLPYYCVCLMFCKQAYENIKRKAKTASSADKVARFETGGGIFVSSVDLVDEKVLALLGNRATPLANPFDSDAAYNAGKYFFSYLKLS